MYEYDQKKQYISEGETFENKTAFVLERIVGGTCKPATKEENKKDHIDLHWYRLDQDWPIDVKGPKKYNRWDNSYSDVVWIEGQGISGRPGWIYGKSKFIAFWNKYGITFVPTEKLRKLYDVYLKNKFLHVGVKPNKHYELYRRTGQSDITFTMPIEDLRKIEEVTIPMECIQKLMEKTN